MADSALIVVDLQNDFMPYGTLPVAEGDATVAVANVLMPHYGLVVATQDWHPATHGSFASNHPGSAPGDVVDLGGIDQILWPDHCVQDSGGASFHSALDVAWVDHVTRKGTDPAIDSYSAFFDNARRKETDLHGYLQSREVTAIVVLGLATDYCVLFTVRDALGLGYAVTVVEDGCRAVDVTVGDGRRALDEMRSLGARVARSAELPRGT